MSSTAKLSNLELKTWPKQLLGSLLPGIALSNEMKSARGRFRLVQVYDKMAS
jgi:hypothetical protein